MDNINILNPEHMDDINHDQNLDVLTRRELNALVRVNRIPPELLVHVFLYCLPEYRRWIRKEGRDLAFQSFLHLSHVCSHWRTVAIAEPNLWTILPCSTNAQTSLLFSRAKSAPLDLVFQMDFLEDPGRRHWMKTLLADISRVRWLIIYPSGPWIDIVKPLLTGPAPVLSVLILLADEGETESESTRSLQTPRLRHLELIGCCSLMTTLDLRHIQSLTLTARLAPTIYITAFLATLEDMHELQRLKLVEVFHMPSSLEESPVRLRKLHHLRVAECAEPGLHFLRALVCPILADIQIILTRSESGTLPGNLCDVPLLALIMPTQENITFWSDGGCVSLESRPLLSPKDTREVHVEISRDVTESKALVDALLDVAALADIRALTMMASPGGGSAIISRMAERALLCSVRTLVVGDADAFDAVCALHSLADDKPVLAELEHLHFNDGVEFGKEYDGQTLWAFMQLQLQVRAMRESARLTIHLKESFGVYAEDIDALRETG
jgi:hypothetical protein